MSRVRRGREPAPTIVGYLVSEPGLYDNRSAYSALSGVITPVISAALHHPKPFSSIRATIAADNPKQNFETAFPPPLPPVKLLTKTSEGGGGGSPRMARTSDKRPIGHVICDTFGNVRSLAIYKDALDQAIIKALRRNPNWVDVEVTKQTGAFPSIPSLPKRAKPLLSNWKGPDLMSHQIETSASLCHSREAGLSGMVVADPPGSGKTVSVLAHLSRYEGSVLVIAQPCSVKGWQSEVSRCLGVETAVCTTQKEFKRLAQLADAPPPLFVVTTPQFVFGKFYQEHRAGVLASIGQACWGDVLMWPEHTEYREGLLAALRSSASAGWLLERMQFESVVLDERTSYDVHRIASFIRQFKPSFVVAINGDFDISDRTDAVRHCALLSCPLSDLADEVQFAQQRIIVSSWIPPYPLPKLYAAYYDWLPDEVPSDHDSSEIGITNNAVLRKWTLAVDQTDVALEHDHAGRGSSLLNNRAECPVCLESAPDVAIVLECGHALCLECFRRICMQVDTDDMLSKRCPTCRSPYFTAKIGTSVTWVGTGSAAAPLMEQSVTTEVTQDYFPILALARERSKLSGMCLNSKGLALVELLTRHARERVVVFCDTASQATAVHLALQNAIDDRSVLKHWGTVSVRSKSIDAFRSSVNAILVCLTSASPDLSCASAAIYAVNNNDNDLPKSASRLCRIGQTREVCIYLLRWSGMSGGAAVAMEHVPLPTIGLEEES